MFHDNTNVYSSWLLLFVISIFAHPLSCVVVTNSLIGIATISFPFTGRENIKEFILGKQLQWNLCQRSPLNKDHPVNKDYISVTHSDNLFKPLSSPTSWNQPVLVSYEKSWSNPRSRAYRTFRSITLIRLPYWSVNSI